MLKIFDEQITKNDSGIQFSRTLEIFGTMGEATQIGCSSYACIDDDNVSFVVTPERAEFTYSVDGKLILRAKVMFIDKRMRVSINPFELGQRSKDVDIKVMINNLARVLGLSVPFKKYENDHFVEHVVL